MVKFSILKSWGSHLMTGPGRDRFSPSCTTRRRIRTVLRAVPVCVYSTKIGREPFKLYMTVKYWMRLVNLLNNKEITSSKC